MSKLYTVDKYKEAVFSLAEHHNYTALEYEGDDEYTLIFRIFEKGNKIPIGMWPITLKDNVRDVKVIEYTEYLVFPHKIFQAPVKKNSMQLSKCYKT
jgi:hypothetical protein